MEKLWAPWRMEYILSDKETECAFCQKQDHTTCNNHILKSGEHCFVIMNIYPYNSGHLLVVPHRHVSELEDLSDQESTAISKAIVASCRCLKQAIHPQGFNIGLNLGRIAGAGITQHLHWHIVPRWSGDVNFMPVLAEAKIISQHLEDTYNFLKPYFNKEG